MVRCGSGSAGESGAGAHDRRQEVGGEGSLQHERVGAGPQCRVADRVLVVHADGHDRSAGAAAAQLAHPSESAVVGEGEVDHGHVWLEPPRAFDQRGLVRDHDDRAEHAVKEAAHAFGEAVVPVRKQNATEMLRVQDASLPK